MTDQRVKRPQKTWRCWALVVRKDTSRHCGFQQRLARLTCHRHRKLEAAAQKLRALEIPDDIQRDTQ